MNSVIHPASNKDVLCHPLLFSLRGEMLINLYGWVKNDPLAFIALPMKTAFLKGMVVHGLHGFLADINCQWPIS